MITAILFTTFINAQPHFNIKSRLRSFCENHLIADDPWQYEHLTNDQVIRELVGYRQTATTPAMLVFEAHRRLKEPMAEWERLQMMAALN